MRVPELNRKDDVVPCSSPERARDDAGRVDRSILGTEETLARIRRRAVIALLKQPPVSFAAHCRQR